MSKTAGDPNVHVSLAFSHYGMYGLSWEVMKYISTGSFGCVNMFTVRIVDEWKQFASYTFKLQY